MPNQIIRAIPPREKRSPDRLRAQYELEKECAAILMSADREQRSKLYNELYDRLHLEIYDHPTPRAHLNESAKGDAERRFRTIERYVDGDSVYLEIGTGSCNLLNLAATKVRKAYGVDVSIEASKGVELKDNAEILLSDGSSIPLDDDSVDFAFSDQLMEHLHPEDAALQLKEIMRVLKKGAAYYCITPSRMTGPHDISWFYDEQASGLHLKEYNLSEVQQLFRASGFERVRYIWTPRGLYLGTYPIAVFIFLEHLTTLLPDFLRRFMKNSITVNRLMDVFLNIRVIGYKP